MLYKGINKRNHTIRPATVYKDFSLNITDKDIAFQYGSAISSSKDTIFVSTYNEEAYKYISINNIFYNNDLIRLGKSNLFYINVDRDCFGYGILKNSVSINNIYYTASINRPYLSTGSINIVDDGTGKLYDSGSSMYTGSIGDVFYDKGLVVLTDRQYSIYVSQSLASVSASITYNYKSTFELFENELYLTVGENEYNNTTNQTYYSGSLPLYSDDLFRPIITGFGLYDQYNQLVATVKLNKPVMKSKIHTNTFIIKFDY